MLNRSGKRVAATTPDRSKHMNTICQHFDERSKRSFGYWNALDYFLERSVFGAGLRLQCPVCAYYNWFDLDTISYLPKCARCLNNFNLSFEGPSQCELVLSSSRSLCCARLCPRWLCRRAHFAVHQRFPLHRGDMGDRATLRPLNCEVDFIAWHRSREILNDERDEPLLVIGEAKSFGRNAINEDVVVDLRKVADRFPGAIMIVSSLREIKDYTAEELQRLRELALWGRRDVFQGQARNLLICSDRNRTVCGARRL